LRWRTQVSRVLDSFVRKARRGDGGGDWLRLLSEAFVEERGVDPLASWRAARAAGVQAAGAGAGLGAGTTSTDLAEAVTVRRAEMAADSPQRPPGEGEETGREGAGSGKKKVVRPRVRARV
jgi:hypothetical protein